MNTDDQSSQAEWGIFEDWIAANIFASGLSASPHLVSRSQHKTVAERMSVAEIWPSRRVPLGSRRAALGTGAARRVVREVARWQRTRAAWARVTARWFAFACGGLGTRGTLASMFYRSPAAHLIAGIGPGDPRARAEDAKVFAHAVLRLVPSSNRRKPGRRTLEGIARFVLLCCFPHELYDEDLERAVVASLKSREAVAGEPLAVPSEVRTPRFAPSLRLPEGPVRSISPEQCRRIGEEVWLDTGQERVFLGRAFTAQDAEVLRLVLMAMAQLAGVVDAQSGRT